MHFNTALSALMIFLNAAEEQGSVTKETALTFTKLLAPLAPHLAEELWETLGEKSFVTMEVWPSYDPKLITEETITIAVQVNGKVRATIEVLADITEEEAFVNARAQENVRKHLEGKALKKAVYVKGRVVSLVVERIVDETVDIQ